VCELVESRRAEAFGTVTPSTDRPPGQVSDVDRPQQKPARVRPVRGISTTQLIQRVLDAAPHEMTDLRLFDMADQGLGNAI
jgi:hypothetical protein